MRYPSVLYRISSVQSRNVSSSNTSHPTSWITLRHPRISRRRRRVTHPHRHPPMFPARVLPHSQPLAPQSSPQSGETRIFLYQPRCSHSLHPGFCVTISLQAILQGQLLSQTVLSHCSTVLYELLCHCCATCISCRVFGVKYFRVTDLENDLIQCDTTFHTM